MYEELERILRSALLMAVLLFSTLILGGCVGSIVGAAADVAIEVVKVPFKVAGAVVDLATDDDD